MAVLSDQAAGDKRKIEEIRRSEILKVGQFYTIAGLLGREEADIEDIFEPEIFAKILNGCYEIFPPNELTAAKLKAAAPNTERLVKQAEAAFAVMPMNVPEFNHYAPASWLIRNPRILDAKSVAVIKTLDRAEEIFENYNKIL
ncbi:MAG TPA: hypothetical protein VHL31_22420 [Geminicoccus sp.]|uniref:hypothetical protein n=1 Tax=Geminicoccus sp. TaxID=2024832 RepID=UPI002E31F052|nr:hypothetical protein [Geminicoccus sp.]HEX2529038.1 hypothetical protein [Geminicoccus sp.]